MCPCAGSFGVSSVFVRDCSIRSTPGVRISEYRLGSLGKSPSAIVLGWIETHGFEICFDLYYIYIHVCARVQVVSDYDPLQRLLGVFHAVQLTCW